MTAGLNDLPRHMTTGLNDLWLSDLSRLMPTWLNDLSRHMTTGLLFFKFWLRMCFAPQWRAIFWHLYIHPKVLGGWRFLTLFTSTCASRQDGEHFFDISTSKSRPTLRCFVHFEFQMCFAPQRCAFFRHLNFSKCSEAEMFCTFSLRNLLRARTACNFSFFICPDGSAPAVLASLLFDPPGPQNIGKTHRFATFLPFRTPASSLFWRSPSLIFSVAVMLFHLSMLSEV